MLKQLAFTIPVLWCLAIHTSAQQFRTQSSLEERARQLEPFITEAARRYGVDARILRLICFAESRFRIDAVSRKGARGPMQLMPETARRFGIRNPHDPKQAINGASRYLQFLLRRFGGRLDLTLASYNAGEGTVESFITGKPVILQNGKIINARGIITGGIPPYRETQMYVDSILTALSKSPPTNPHRQQQNSSFNRDYTIDVTSNTEAQLNTKPHRRCAPPFVEIQ